MRLIYIYYIKYHIQFTTHPKTAKIVLKFIPQMTLYITVKNIYKTSVLLQNNILYLTETLDLVLKLLEFKYIFMVRTLHNKKICCNISTSKIIIKF